MRSLLTLLYDGLSIHNIELPRKRFTTTAGFMRWGKNNRYWAVATGDGYTFGNYADGFKSSIFPKKENSLSDFERHQRMQYIKKAQAEAEKQSESIPYSERRDFSLSPVIFRDQSPVPRLIGALAARLFRTISLLL